MKKPALVIVILLACIITAGSITLANTTQLLDTPWHLTGNNSASEAYQTIAANSIIGVDNITLTYDLHGKCALGGDASAIVLDQDGWKMISLSEYGQNCKDGSQTVRIPFSHFKDINTGEVLDTEKPLTGLFHTRFWNRGEFTVDITMARIAKYSTSLCPDGWVSAIVGICPDQRTSGTITVNYLADPAVTEWVKFYVDNREVNTDTASPYYLNGDTNGVSPGWNTTSVRDGKHNLLVRTKIKDSVEIREDSLDFYIANSSGVSVATASADLAPSGRPTATPSPTLNAAPPPPSPPPVPSPPDQPVPPGGSWGIQSVDAMKQTKDVICGPKTKAWIEAWVDRVKYLGANYVAISTPYDNPACGDSVSYTKLWISVIRAKGLHVWHRQMPLAFEGIYNVPKKNTTDYLSQITAYIKAHPDNYRDGDIFTPIPEPQNGGIAGITHCAGGVCQYRSKEQFNDWLRKAISESKRAFSEIGKNKIQIGYFGFDGFVAWGHGNPDWNGILEDATVEAMGNITIDHYPELVGSTMDKDLSELEARFPGVDIVIGEWGTVTGNNTEETVLSTMKAAQRQSVKGFNYWQFGPDGSGEQLINNDLAPGVQFDEVRSFYR